MLDGGVQREGSWGLEIGEGQRLEIRREEKNQGKGQTTSFWAVCVHVCCLRMVGFCYGG